VAEIREELELLNLRQDLLFGPKRLRREMKGFRREMKGFRRELARVNALLRDTVPRSVPRSGKDAIVIPPAEVGI